mmetsp:Transcript_83004/g.220210  ORF Transcript_83004/g.220210 Transcript_83004/m.220210 type:complete len:251 (+) Transcript_83004:369-1121(+)
MTPDKLISSGNLQLESAQVISPPTPWASEGSTWTRWKFSAFDPVTTKRSSLAGLHGLGNKANRVSVWTLKDRVARWPCNMIILKPAKSQVCSLTSSTNAMPRSMQNRTALRSMTPGACPLPKPWIHPLGLTTSETSSSARSRDTAAKQSVLCGRKLSGNCAMLAAASSGSSSSVSWPCGQVPATWPRQKTMLPPAKQALGTRPPTSWKPVPPVAASSCHSAPPMSTLMWRVVMWWPKLCRFWVACFECHL